VARFKWDVEHTTVTGAPSSCKDTGWLREIEVTNASAFYEFNAHPARYSFDQDRRVTAWRQPIHDNHKNYIIWTLSTNPASTHHVRLICIINGWSQNYDTYRNTGRVHKVHVVGLKHEKPLAREGCDKTRRLKDTPPERVGAVVSIRFDCDAHSVRLTILSTYDGLAKRNDVAISDVRFYG
jgi:hypothetical protein